MQESHLSVPYNRTVKELMVGYEWIEWKIFHATKSKHQIEAPNRSKCRKEKEFLFQGFSNESKKWNKFWILPFKFSFLWSIYKTQGRNGPWPPQRKRRSSQFWSNANKSVQIFVLQLSDEKKYFVGKDGRRGGGALLAQRSLVAIGSSFNQSRWQ